MRIALVGNPNCGKSTLFNNLTGANQRIGNWAGTTVEKREGSFAVDKETHVITDLPGIYTLLTDSVVSLDKHIALRHIRSAGVDLLLNIIDSSQLAVQLRLSARLLEMGLPTVFVLTMDDVMTKNKLRIHKEILEKMTGCPVVLMTASNAEDKQELLEILRNIASGELSAQPQMLRYGFEEEKAIGAMEAHLKNRYGLNDPLIARRQALRLLSGGAPELLEEGPTVELYNQLKATVFGGDPILAFSLAHHNWARNMAGQMLAAQPTERVSWFTRRLDRIVLSRLWGMPIFFGMMYLTFQVSITLGALIQPFFDNLTQVLFVDGFMWLGSAGFLPLWAGTFLGQGLGLGLSTVATFIPQLGTLFLFLSFLESSGYLARASFVMARAFSSIGLPGQAFTSLIIGFGCNVPSVMGTRTISHEGARLRTVMMAPFISCGARLTIYMILGSAFFPTGGALVIFSFYIFGIIAAIFTALALRLPKEDNTLGLSIEELPYYHIPQIKALVRSTFWRLRAFVVRAGRVIVPLCIIVGFLGSFRPADAPKTPSTTYLASVGRAISPLFHPMGVDSDNWPAVVSLFTGAIAKEVVVGSMNVLYAQQSEEEPFDADAYDFWGGILSSLTGVVEAVRGFSSEGLINPFKANLADGELSSASLGNMVAAFKTPWAAYAYLMFILLYVPCAATIGAIRQEVGLFWATVSSVWGIILAYAAAVVIFQIGRFGVAPLSALGWIVFALGITALGFRWIRRSIVVESRAVLNNDDLGGVLTFRRVLSIIGVGK